jgi:hypothetical protein
MTGTKFFWGWETLVEVREQKKTVDASPLGIKNWWRMFETVQDNLQNFLVSSENITERAFVHCNDTGILRKLQHVSGQAVGSKQTLFVGPDSR